MAKTTELKQLKCKTCGEPLDLNTAADGVIKCAVCDSIFTLPKKEALSEVVQFLKQGEHDLDTGKFDDAHAAFAKAAELDKTEPEAYWGMALAEFRIQYLKDEVNNRLQPVCHEINDRDFEDNSNFLKALRYATEAQCAEYERRGKEINYIKEEFYKLAWSGLDYDCFICVKVSGENGGKTADYKTADDIYFELKGKGYKPFFSERELGGVTGADYEARILYALYSSECMLVVCFDEAYLRTKWVKNEYTRFLKLVNDEEKESDSIALVFGNSPIEKLPNRHGKIQGIAVNSLSAMERIVSFVDSHTPEAKRKREEAARRREEEARRKERENEELRNELAELKKMFLNQQSARLAEEETKRKAEEERIKKQTEERAKKEAAEKAGKEREAAEQKAKKQAEEKAKKEAAAVQAATAKTKTPAPVAKPASALVKQTPAKPASAPAPAASADFVIKNGVIEEYVGTSENVVIPEGVKGIGFSAFEKSAFIKSLTIPDSLTSISTHGFIRCGKLESISVGSNNKAFKSVNNCVLSKDGKTLILGSNKSIIPNGVTVIGESAFRGRAGLNSLEVPASVTTIGDCSFFDCVGLTDIKLTTGLIKIENEAFENCKGLKNLKFPPSLMDINHAAFIGCSGLERIFVDSGNIKYMSSNNCLLSKDGKSLILGCKNSVIPNSVAFIGWYAFRGCSGLNSVTIPESVTSIGIAAFCGCSGLSSIIIPKGVTNIGGVIFTDCGDLKIYCRAESKPAGWKDVWNSKKSFSNERYQVVWGYKGGIAAPVANVAKPAPAPVKQTPAKPAPAPAPTPSADFVIENGVLKKYKGNAAEVVIPEGVTIIAGSPFDKYYNRLKKISIPATVKKISVMAFDGCALESITVNPGNAHYKSENNCLLSRDGKKLVYGCRGLTSITIPNSVTSIDSWAFSHFSGTSISIPNSVTSIDSYAFFDCIGLKSITIPDSVTHMSSCVFEFANYSQHYNLTIYCRAKKKPEGWNKDWNVKEKGKVFSSRHKVIWDYKGD